MRDDHTFNGVRIRHMTNDDLAKCLHDGFEIKSGLEEAGMSEASAIDSIRMRLDVERVRRTLGIPLLR